MTGSKTPTALGTENIGKLLMQYAVPAIIAMTASSLYNIVDSIFIGHGVGAMALSGLALTFPLMNLAAAFGSLVGVGASTLISVKLIMERFDGIDLDSARRVAGNGFYYLMGDIARLHEAVLAYARDFMQIILLGNVVTHMYLGLNAVLRASGHPKEAMYATIATVVVNVILAPIFIFVFGWGIRGAATATVLAQTVSLVWQLRLFSNPNELLHFRKGIYRLRRNIVIGSLAIGLSPFLMNIAACFIVILINQGLKKYGGDLAIGAFGIANRLSFIIVMIVMGLNQGMQPIAGYNFGAQLYDRVTQVLKKTIIYATVVTTVGFVVCMFFPHLVVSIFTTDAELVEISAYGLRIVVMFFPIIGFQMVTSNFFQSIGMAGKAIFLSLTRQLLILIPCLLILPRFFGADGVWYSMPVSDLLASVIAAFMLVSQFREFRKAGPPSSVV